MSAGVEQQDGYQSAATDVDTGVATPQVNQALGAYSQGLNEFMNLIGGNLVAGFAPEQQQAFAAARDVAGGGGGFLPAAQQALMGAAGGTDISQFMPASAVTSLEQIAQADPFSQLPPEVAERLTAVAGGRNIYGGEGFQESVDAAVQAALPGISSAFGGTAGGLSGGLARAEVGRSGVLEALRQQGQRRQEQIQAASLLGDIGRAGTDARLRASGLMLGEGSRERDRALSAARDLPGIGLAGANILRDIGGERQQYEQRLIDAPIDAQARLMDAALAGIGGMSPLYGEDYEARERLKKFAAEIDQEGVAKFAGKFG